jgi:REP element-mobilizing transposase RayT
MFAREPNPPIERVKFELRATGLKPEQGNPLRSGTHTRGYLPHVKREGARYFVTFRLADSLPKEALLKIQAERAERLNRYHQGQEAAKRLGVPVPQSADLESIERDYFPKVEHYLDKATGECWLRQPEIAGLVADAIRFFEGKRYLLQAWVVMPNHIHVVLWPMPSHTLSSIVQSWKRFTARQANRVLNRSGQAFWQPESFDHWIRNDEEHGRCCRYVVYNPVKARLCAAPEDWKWSSAWHVPQSA